MKKNKPSSIIFNCIIVFITLYTINGHALEADSTKKESFSGAFVTPVPDSSSFKQKTQIENTITQIKQEIDLTLKQLKAAIGNASCANSKQCKSVAVGKKACGGPVAYLAYSNKQYDTKNISELSTKHQQLNAKLNRLTNAVSDCMFVIEPPLECQMNVCQIVPTN